MPLSVQYYKELLQEDFPFEIEYVVSFRINKTFYNQLSNDNQKHYKRYFDFWQLAYGMDDDCCLDAFLESELLLQIFQLQETFATVKDKVALQWLNGFIEHWKSVPLKTNKRDIQPQWAESFYEIYFANRIHDVLDEFPIAILGNFVIDNPNDFESLFYHEQ